MPDHERVRGQIARGEVVAGAEGARRIAARHEAAYGDVWTRRAAWMDAVRGLTTIDTTEAEAP